VAKDQRRYLWRSDGFRLRASSLFSPGIAVRIESLVGDTVQHANYLPQVIPCIEMEVFVFGREHLAINGCQRERRVIEIQVIIAGVAGLRHGMQSVYHYHAAVLPLPPFYRDIVIPPQHMSHFHMERKNLPHLGARTRVGRDRQGRSGRARLVGLENRMIPDSLFTTTTSPRLYISAT